MLLPLLCFVAGVAALPLDDPPITNVTTVHLVYFTHFDVRQWHASRLTIPSGWLHRADVLRCADRLHQFLLPARCLLAALLLIGCTLSAYDTCAKLRARGGVEQFVWTTHPWLLHEFLNNATGDVTKDKIAQLEAAIARGDIQWHAAPFNLQHEVMDPSVRSLDLAPHVIT